jgi:hypothetical protein
LSRKIQDARTDFIATDKSTYSIQEKVKMVGKMEKDAERKVEKKETSHTT